MGLKQATGYAGGHDYVIEFDVNVTDSIFDDISS